MNTTPILFTDFYKVDHRRQYPEGTEFVYSNFTARYSRVPGVEGVVVFGIQYFIKEFLIKRFNEDFFNAPKDAVIAAYQRRMDNALGKGSITTEHLKALHDLGYLPIRLKALEEGTICPIGVPMLTIVNTKKEFYWVTNFLETLLSNALWHPMTTATIAGAYKYVLTKFAEKTSDMPEFVQFQGHDFSMRGQTSMESSVACGAGHLTSFVGTDTIPAIDFLERYYGADCELELIGCSVPATEHSVMCLGGKESELETFSRLLTKVYPAGIVSIVSDTWDYWKVITETIPALRNVILGRDGKLVVRPDSGDPVKIICGDEAAPAGSPEQLGTVSLLWDIFGGKVNSKSFKQLDAHIGVIYGDSITLDRCLRICERLEEKGFASTNVVFGIGSYTYQYVTRDTFGFAMKATWGVLNGVPTDLQKTPKTDVGTKHSARGLLCVNENLTLSEGVSPAEEETGLLRVVFEDGELYRPTTLSEVRMKLRNSLKKDAV